MKLQQWTVAHGTPQQVALRCRIVLAAAAGESDVSIAKRLAVHRNTVILWRKRFGEEGLDGLWDIARGRGRKPTYPIDKIAAIVDATLQTKTCGDDALELPDHGAKPGREQVHRQQYLARPPSPATSHGDL